MRVIEIFGGMGKNFRVCRYNFFIYLKVASKQGAPEPSAYNYCSSFSPTEINDKNLNRRKK